MKKYELMTIIKVATGESGAKEVSKQIQELIALLGGKVEKTDFWGKRKLAYEIKRNTEGFYEVINFELDPGSIIKFKSKMNLMQDLIRYLVTAKS